MSPKKGARSKKKGTVKERIVRKEKTLKNKPPNFKVSIPLLNTGKFESNNLQALLNCSKLVSLVFHLFFPLE